MAFSYVNNRFSIVQNGVEVDLQGVATKINKPTYVYDLDEIERRLEHISKCFTQNTSVHYAMKANPHPEILKKVAALGFGVDVVSAGEIKLAFENGIPAKNIVFSGVGKSKSELKYALEHEIAQINVESPLSCVELDK
ncbi:MAG: hypothetical protein R2827_02415 [Bdellovibrionales bacterium]